LFDEGRATLEEARAAAIAEGFPDPDDLYRKPKAEPLPPDPIETLRRKSLPRAVQRDLEDSRTRTAEEYTYSSIRAEQRATTTEAEDKLAAFRNQGPLTYPPAYPDS